MKYTRLLLSIVYLMLMSTIQAFAQQYPVQVITQLLPPYTLNVPAWYNGTNEKLVVLLTNQDMNRLTQVRLRIKIESPSGVRITSRQGSFSPIINLDSGVPVRLSLSDLAPYFKPENLNFESGISYANYVKSYTLPEGFYFICFEAVEVFSGQVVGVQCGQAYLSLNDPPFLNMPRKGESILHRDPTNIIFQWTPRHMSDPYLAFNTEYEFTMVELLDNGMVPDAAFAINRPAFHQERSSTSTFLYGPSHPLLTPGRRYAWRICVKSNDGSNLSSFKNQGCSEVYWFTYQNDCLPPINIQAEAMSVAARITWTPVMASQNGTGLGGTYKVDYREYKMSPGDWQSTTSSTNRVTLDKLDPDRSYEYRVGRSCDDNLTYVYSDIKRFKTNVEVTRGDCTAGGEPVPITNREPIQTLHAGDVITAGGGSPIRITQVSGQGEFTGYGYGTISLLGHAQFKVKFANIVVNTDKQLIGGFIESTYDKDEKQIADLDQIFSDISTLTDDLAGLMTKLDTPITSKAAQEKIEKEVESVNERMDPLFSSIETLLEKRTDLSEEQKKTYRARNKELRSSTLIAQNGDNDWQKKSREQLGKKYDALTEIRNELKAMPSGNAVQKGASSPALASSKDEADTNTLEKIYKVFDFYKSCSSSGWKSYEDGGIIPHCFWKDTSLDSDRHYSAQDIAFVSGVFDGAYGQVKGMYDLATHTNDIFYAYTTAKLKCRNVKDDAADYQVVINRIKETKKDAGFIASVEKWYREGEAKKLKNTLETCTKYETIRNNTEASITGLWEVASHWDQLKTAIGKIGDQLADYFKELKSTDEIARYKHGKLFADVAGLFVGAQELKSGSMLLKKVEGVAKKSKKEFGVLGEKIAGKKGALAKVGKRVTKNADDLILGFKKQTGINAVKSIDEKLLAKAKSWQGSGSYPGIDDWVIVEIPIGTKIYRGVPGPSEFFSVEKSLSDVGHSKVEYWKSLQVQPHPIHGYRPKVEEYTIKKSTKVALAKTLANSQHGSGGAWQLFVEDYQNKINFIRGISLK